MLTLNRQSVQAIFYSLSSYAARAWALSKADDALRRISVVAAERDDALRSVTVLGISLAGKDTGSPAVQRAKKELRAEHEDDLRQMGSSTRKVSYLESAISPVCEMLATSADSGTRGCVARVEHTCLETASRQESLRADVEVAKV